jgi:hypothetical protein
VARIDDVGEVPVFGADLMRGQRKMRMRRHLPAEGNGKRDSPNGPAASGPQKADEGSNGHAILGGTGREAVRPEEVSTATGKAVNRRIGS